jgi:starch phosphorylase
MLAEVGADNIYIFGLRVEEITALRRSGAYRPRDYYDRQPELRRVLDAFNRDLFCAGEPGLFRWLWHKLLEQGDEYFHLADFLPYLEAQERAGKDYRTPAVWTRKTVLNVARMGKFSSDRTISEYAREIWGLQPYP